MGENILPCGLCGSGFRDSDLIGNRVPDIFCENCFKRLKNANSDFDNVLEQLTDCIKKLDLFRNIELNENSTLRCKSCNKLFIDFTKLEDKFNLTGGLCWKCLIKSNEDFLNGKGVKK